MTAGVPENVIHHGRRRHCGRLGRRHQSTGGSGDQSIDKVGWLAINRTGLECGSSCIVARCWPIGRLKVVVVVVVAAADVDFDRQLPGHFNGRAIFIGRHVLRRPTKIAAVAVV